MWEVGDLAVCVDDTPNPFSDTMEVKVGQIYRVAAVTSPRPHVLYGTVCGLILDGVHCSMRLGFAAARFRKVVKDREEACEAEFVQLLNRSKKRIEA